MSSGIKYGTGRGKYIGQSIVYPVPIPLKAEDHKGACVYASDGQIYYSDGEIWIIPVDVNDISRPQALEPTNAVEATQLRLSNFRSAQGYVQTGVLFEVSTSGGPNFDTSFTRLIQSPIANIYQLLYPDDGFVPGDDVWWRARYLGDQGTQSPFSLPYKQKFPEFITTPVPITKENDLAGFVEVSTFDAAYDYIYAETQFEFYSGDGTTLLAEPTILETPPGNRVKTPDILQEDQFYQFRARYGARAVPGAPIEYSQWSVKRKFLNATRSLKLQYDISKAINNTIGIPLGGNVNVVINWGDGTSETVTTGGVKSHTYSAGTGIVNVSVSGTLSVYGGQSGVTAAHQRALTRVDAIGFQMGLTSMSRAFQYTTIDLAYVTKDIPPEVTDMSYMFAYSGAMPDLRSMNVSKVQNMEGMFFASVGSGPLIEGWDVSKVTNVFRMFHNSGFDRPFDYCNWASLTSMEEMFSGAGGSVAVKFNQPVNNWKVGTVTSMKRMFYLDQNDLGNGTMVSNFNSPVDKWDVSKVTNFSGMFGGADIVNGGVFTHAFDQDISGWDVSSATDMSYMFGIKPYGFHYDDGTYRGSVTRNFTLNPDLSSWDVSKVTTMEGMFAQHPNFTGDLSMWNCASCTNMAGMFVGGGGYTMGAPDGSKLLGPRPTLVNGSRAWLTPVLRAANSMFTRNQNFDGVLNGWDVSSVTDMRYMFYGAKFNQPLDQWVTSSVTNMSYMFCIEGGSYGTRSNFFNQNIGSWDVSSVTNMSNMFGSRGGGGPGRIQAFNNGGSPDIQNWITSSVTDMSYMFGSVYTMDCYFNQPIGSWDVSNVTNMTGMFAMVGATTNSTTVHHFNQDISQWDLNSKVVLSNFMKVYSGTTGRVALSQENYSRLLTGWANRVDAIDGPVNISTAFDRQVYNTTIYEPESRFTNAADARNFLTTSIRTTVSGSATAAANGDYILDQLTGVYRKADGWYLLKSGSVWRLYNNLDAMQAQGTGVYPWDPVDWSGVLADPTVSVLNTGGSWTITGDLTA